MVSAVITGIVVAAEYGVVAGLIAGAIAAYSAIEQQNAKEEAQRAQAAARREAEERADAAKGTQLVISGDITTLRVVYGRNLVGGTRVYHGTFNNFAFTPETSNFKRFKASTNIDSSVSGTKHEFLITQQALGFGGINECYAVDINERKIDGEYINAYNEVVYDGSGTLVSPYEYGAIVNMSYNGSIVDPLCSGNDSARTNSLFTDIAYATGVFRLNREDPQYSGVPTVQFYVEGQKVRSIQGSAGNRFMSSVKTYSNNPVLVLIDYLTNNLYGRGLSDSLLDLETFYNAYLVCEKVVMTSVPLEGKLWRSKGGVRSIKRFECNLALDTAKPIRENIEMILDTMEDAKLIWSGGKYKLMLSYPLLYNTSTAYAVGDVVQYTDISGASLYECILANTNTPVTNTACWKSYIRAVITDADLIREGETTVAWPNAQTRLNFCTVRYLNESKDFKEDTVSWPPKMESLYSTFLAEDSGIAFESEVFATGVTSYYHALAKAESLVRLSRAGVTYSFTVNRDFIRLEPGDKIKLYSDVLGIPGELLSILEVDPDGDGRIRVSAVKFEAAALAWNVADNEYVPPRNIYAVTIANIPVGDIVYTAGTGAGYITWTAVPDSRVVGYTVYTAQTYNGVNTVWIDRGTVSTTRFDLPDAYSTDFYVTVVPVTARNQRSPKSGWPAKLITYQRLGTVANFGWEQNSLGFQLYWDVTNSSRVSGYEIRKGASWASSELIAFQRTGEFQLPPLAAGTHTFRIKAVDTNNIYSLNDAATSFTVTAPLSVTITPNVIDNNVMLYWSSASSQQAVSYYEVRKGDDYNTALVMGKVSGLFATFFEVAGGVYRYWVTPYDVAGNKGVSSSVVITVSQPPDYSLRNSIVSSLGSSTYTTFSSSGVTPVNNYVAAGFVGVDYSQNNLTMPTASWIQEVFDMGMGSPATIAATKASVTIDYTVTSGTPVLTTYITSSADNVTYTAAVAGSEKNLYNFRYLKVRIEVTGGTIVMNNYNLRLSSKTVTESGVVSCNAADVGGTVVTFTKNYVDVTSISVTPSGVTPVIPMYDFVDAPNPSTFKILLFNTAGVRVSGNASYTVEGVI